MEEFSFTRHFLNKRAIYYAFGVVGSIAINAVYLAVPSIIGGAIDSLMEHRSDFLNYIYMLLAIIVSTMILKYIYRNLLLGSIRHFEYVLRDLLFDKALRLPISYYEKNGPGKVMALMTNDVTSVRVALGLGVMLLLDALFFCVFAICIMMKNASVLSTLYVLSPMFLILPATLIVTKKMRSRQRESQASFSDITEFVQELFNGIHVIRAFNKERRSYEVFQSLNDNNFKRNMIVSLLDSIVEPLTYVAPLLCIALNIMLHGTKVTEGVMTVGEFITLNGYLLLIIGPLMGVGALASVTQKGLASMDRIQDFFRVSEEEEAGEATLLPLEDIHIKNLTFTYPETTHEALKEVSLTIPRGKFIGIVGAPGSGKTTLFKMLLRMQDTPKGHIFIGNQDITTVPLASLRRSMAYVPQTSYVMSGSVEENISFGLAGGDPLSVQEAAKRAYLEVELEERLKSEVLLKEGGRDLSGGQKQRLSIARALWKQAPYLLLDDAFSALDFHSAYEVLRELRSHSRETIVFISQRIEAIVDADIIYVLEEGKMVESGSHQKLLQLEGVYAKLYRQQMEGSFAHEE